MFMENPNFTGFWGCKIMVNQYMYYTQEKTEYMKNVLGVLG